MRLIVALLALIAALPAAAQVVNRNCTTVACSFISDNFPLAGDQPVTCTLYVGVAAITTEPVGVSGSFKFCQIAPRTFAQGTHIITARATDAHGDLSEPSNTITLVTAAPVLPNAPVNLRIVGGAVLTGQPGPK